jgi:hypothetical protein
MFGAQKPRISVPITYQSQTTREESRGTTLALWAIFFIVKYTKHHTLLYFRALTPIQHINIPLQIRFKTHTRRFWCHTSSITATFFFIQNHHISFFDKILSSERNRTLSSADVHPHHSLSKGRDTYFFS